MSASLPYLLLLSLSLALFPSAGRDDAHISYWSAYTLSHFGQILNYNGDRIEQSSSLLQVLLLSVEHRITGVDLVTLGKLTSIFFGLASLLILSRTLSYIDASLKNVTLLLTASSVFFLYWLTGGMETTLVSFGTLVLILCCGSYLSSSGSAAPALLAIAMLSLSRPEMPIVMPTLFLGTAGLDFLRTGKRTTQETRKWLLLIGSCVAALLLLFAFRMWYFHDLFPQSVRAKSVTLSLEVLRSRALIFVMHIRGYPFFSLTALLVLFSLFYLAAVYVRQDRANYYLLLCLCFTIVYVLFIVGAGDDWMEGERFLVPVVGPAMILLAITLKRFIPSTLAYTAVIALLVALQLVATLRFATYLSASSPIWSSASLSYNGKEGTFSWFETHNRINARDIPLVEPLNQMIGSINSYKKSRVWVISGQMGLIPYHAAIRHYGKVGFLDLAGLTTRFFTDCAVTNALPRLNSGIALPYSFFFSKGPQLERDCRIPKPDIIVDQSYEDSLLAVRAGYTIVFRERGEVMGNVAWLRGQRVSANQFIAVRNELLPAVAAARFSQ